MIPALLSLSLPKWFYSLSRKSSRPLPGDQPPSFLSKPSSSTVLPFSKISSGAQKSEVLQDGLVSLPHNSSTTSAAENECHLLNLPLEIRRQIWRDVLGRETFHLQFSWRRLTCLHCGNPDSKRCNGTSLSDSCRKLWHPPQKLWIKKVLFISILSTCEQIYKEAIDILHSENTFTARDGDVVVRLASTIPFVYMKRIRSLRLICPVISEELIPFNHAAFEDPVLMNWYTTDRQGESLTIQPQWTSIWNTLANMSSLRHLDVKLRMLDRVSWAKFNAKSVETLLEPIKKLIAAKPGVLFLEIPFPRATQGRTHSSLRLPWAAEAGWEGDDVWDQLGCEIRRPLWE